MKKDRNQKRLKLLEEDLTPREWAVRLVGRIRSFPTFANYLDDTNESGVEIIAFRRLVDGVKRRGKRDGKTETAIVKAANEAQREFLAFKQLILHTQRLTRRTKSIHGTSCCRLLWKG